jgi:hypothetical protein
MARLSVQFEGKPFLLEEGLVKRVVGSSFGHIDADEDGQRIHFRVENACGLEVIDGLVVASKQPLDIRDLKPGCLIYFVRSTHSGRSSRPKPQARFWTNLEHQLAAQAAISQLRDKVIENRRAAAAAHA